MFSLKKKKEENKEIGNELPNCEPITAQEAIAMTIPFEEQRQNELLSNFDRDLSHCYREIRRHAGYGYFSATIHRFDFHKSVFERLESDGYVIEDDVATWSSGGQSWEEPCKRIIWSQDV